MILGRTDLRKGVSGAKFDAESDFEVHLAVAPQKPSQNSEKTISTQKIRRTIFFDKHFGSEILFVAFLAWFSGSYGQTDLKIRFLVEFCFR